MTFGSPSVSATDGLPAAPAAIAGWLGVALWNAVRIALLPLGPGGFGVRFAHLAIDFGHTLAIGLVVGGAVAGIGRLRIWRPGYAPVLVALAAVAFGQVVLPRDLDGAVERWTDGTGGESLVRLASVLVSLAIPACFLLGRLAAGGRWRFVGLIAAAAIIVSNDQILTSGYPGAHVLMAACGATLLGSSLRGAKLSTVPVRLGPGRARLLVGLAALLSVTAVIVPASGRVKVELLQRDTAFLIPWLGEIGPKTKEIKVEIPKELSPWYARRSRRPDVPPPTSVGLLPPNPIVVLVTIDALRMEVVEPKYEGYAPNLNDIRRKSIYFSQARSSGSDTRFSLATLFVGRHISMMKWNFRSRLRPTLEKDRQPRLPELLSRGGVQTVTGIALPNMLVPRIGIVRGFSEEYIKDDTNRLAGSVDIVNHAIERLRRHGSEPLFYFTHLIDPHAPYRKHGKKKPKTQHEAYLGEVSLSDRELGRLRRAIHELGLAERTVLIVSSDHGEGFGEHGIYRHNKALYEVMVHVPLMIELPGVSPRTVDHHVSLMDLGPTILQIFGLPVPGNWMGESLVPVLLGTAKKTARPIFMERPTERAMLFHDGIKVMLRDADNSEEIYDLRRDPGELDNLRDELGAEGDRRVALVRAYAKAHAGSRTLGPRKARD